MQIQAINDVSLKCEVCNDAQAQAAIKSSKTVMDDVYDAELFVCRSCMRVLRNALANAETLISLGQLETKPVMVKAVSNG
jgi:hypothetical protein